MNHKQSLPPAKEKLRKQTLFFLFMGLFVGSVLVFTVVWSGTKQHLEEKRLEELEKAGSESEAANSPS